MSFSVIVVILANLCGLINADARGYFPRFHAGVRAQVREAIEVALTPRVTDRDLRGYRSAEPGWIADRISCLSVAVEIRRMIMGSEPAFERVRTVLEDDESAKQLVWECWGHMRRNHS